MAKTKYLIIRNGTGEIITNTNDPLDADNYGGCTAVSFQELGIDNMGDLPGHPAHCVYSWSTGDITLDQAKYDEANRPRPDTRGFLSGLRGGMAAVRLNAVMAAYPLLFDALREGDEQTAKAVFDQAVLDEALTTQEEGLVKATAAQNHINLAGN
jgi:hypothetical protein